MNDQHAATILIAAAALGAVLLAAYHYGAGQGRPQPLPAQAWKHSVAFRLRTAEARP